MMIAKRTLKWYLFTEDEECVFDTTEELIDN